MIMRLMSSLKVFDLIYMMVDDANPALNDAQSTCPCSIVRALSPATRLCIRYRCLDRAAVVLSPCSSSGPEEVGQLRGVRCKV
jgi:hypothetical protein